MFTEENIIKILDVKERIGTKFDDINNRRELNNLLFPDFATLSNEEVYDYLPYAKTLFTFRYKALFIGITSACGNFIYNNAEYPLNTLQYDKTDVQNALTCLLQASARFFDELCEYKNKIQDKFDSFHDKECFIEEALISDSDYEQNGPIDRVTDLTPKLHTMDDILECQKKLNDANEAIGYIGQCISTFKKYFLMFDFIVLNDHRLYLNLGKYYKN